MDWFLFITTFVFVSILPGITMCIAMSLGLSLGFSKTLYLMFGQTLALGFVCAICGVGVGAIILKFPELFIALKLIGGVYLLFVSYQIFRHKPHIKIYKTKTNISPKILFFQGVLCSIANPKAWIFMASLFPKFIDVANPFGGRFFLLIGIILIIEFLSLCLYAGGGAAFKKFLSHRLELIEKISAVLIATIAVWMIFE